MKAFAVALTVLLLVMVFVGLLAWVAGVGSRSAPTPTPLAPGSSLVRLVDAPLAPTPLPETVATTQTIPDVSALRQTGILITAMYTVTTVVDKELPPIWMVFNGQQVAVRAQSTVLAGVDLQSVTFDAASRTLHLPPSQIYWVVPNATRSGVIIQSFSPLQTSATIDGSLINAATLAANEQIRAAACERSITTLAAQRAGDVVTALLASVDIRDVTVVAPAGACQ